MVRIGLQISANLENIEELKTNHPDYSFFLKVKCSNCGETSDKWHDVTESERVHSQTDTRNPDGFNFYMKCKMCSRENTIDIVEKSNGKTALRPLKSKVVQMNDPSYFIASYTQDDSGKYKTIVVFDCRGVEPVDFSPRLGWMVRSAENGQSFDDIDLSEDDWVEYDQKNKASVGVYEFASQFIKLKK